MVSFFQEEFTVNNISFLPFFPFGKKYTTWPASKLTPLLDFGNKFGFITPGILK
jgi:hypothetical protein